MRIQSDRDSGGTVGLLLNPSEHFNTQKLNKSNMWT